MAFHSRNLQDRVTMTPSAFFYTTEDSLETVLSPGYFNRAYVKLGYGDTIFASSAVAGAVWATVLHVVLASPSDVKGEGRVVVAKST